MDKTVTDRFFRGIFVICCIFAIVVSSYLLFYYMYPFIIAFFISMFLHPIVTLFENKWKLNRGLTTLFVLCIFFSLSLISSFFLTQRLIRELTEIFVELPTYIDNMTTILHLLENTYISPIYTYINKIVPIELVTYDSFTPFIVEKIKVNMGKLLQQSIILISQLLTSFAYTSLVLVFILLATYFMTKDFTVIIRLLHHSIPKKVINLIKRIFQYAQQSTFGIIRAQVAIAFLTAMIAFFGLALFQIEHLFVIAGVLLIIDLIPYVGIGALFLPWIMYTFFNENYALTIKLTSLYIILIIIRQIIEPRLLAKNLGIHPLMTIIILFLSLNIFGPIGFLITPLSLIVVSSLYHAKITHYLIRFIKEGTI